MVKPRFYRHQKKKTLGYKLLPVINQGILETGGSVLTGIYAANEAIGASSWSQKRSRLVKLNKEGWPCEPAFFIHSDQ